MRRRPRRPLGNRKRRPFAGRRRRNVHGRALNPRLQRELKRANHLMSKGEHDNAANIFTRLAEKALDIGLPYQAGMLFLQSAMSMIFGGKPSIAVKQAIRGLEIFLANSLDHASSSEYQRIRETLESEGFAEALHQIENWADETGLVVSKTRGTSKDSETTFQLPEKCPYCGASLSLEQLTAGGRQAAECHYCASVILPTKS